MRDARRRGPKIRTDWTWGENRQWGDASTEEENDDTPMGRLLQEQEVSRRRAISANNAADFFDAPEVPDNNTAGAARASADAGTPVAVERPRDPANFMFPPRSRNSDANDSHRSEQPVDRDPAYQRPTGESDVVGGGTLDRAFKTYFKTEEFTDAIQKADSDEDSADEGADDVLPNVRQEEDFAPAFAGDEGWGGAEDIRGLPRLVPPPPPLLDGLMFALAFLDPRYVAQDESAFMEPQVQKEQAQDLLRKLSTDPRTLYPYTGPAPAAAAGGWASALGFTSAPLDSATLESAIAKARIARDGTATVPPPLPVRKGGKKQIKAKPGAIGKAARPKKAAVKKVAKKGAVKAVTNIDAKNDERWHTWLAGNPVEPSAVSVVSFKL